MQTPDVTKLDFTSIKSQLVDHFKADGNKFTDWDFEGSNLNAIIDLLAYNTHFNALSAHMATNESFIDSSQLRSSAVSSAKTLGYIPRSSSAASVKLHGSFAAKVDWPQHPTYYSMPRGTRFKVTFEQRTRSFVLINDTTLLQYDNGDYLIDGAAPIVAHEGTIESHLYRVGKTGDNQSKYVIPDEAVDISAITVTVRPNEASLDGEATRYTQYRDVTNTKNDSAVYFIAENSRGLYEITFGNGVFGFEPTIGSIIEIEYLKTSGSHGNGISGSFSHIAIDDATSPLGAVNVLGTLPGERSFGGDDKEPLERLKMNAVNSFATQNRAVTAADYRSLILRKFQNIHSVSVWGGEDNDPPVYGKVFISPKPAASENDDNVVLSPNERSELLHYLSNKKVLSILPVIVEPRYLNIVVDVLFKYDPRLTSYTAAELQSEVRDNVLGRFNLETLNTFDSVFRHSKFIQAVDNASRSITSSLVRVYGSQMISLKDGYSTSGPAEPAQSDHRIDFGVPLMVEDGTCIKQTKTNLTWYEDGYKTLIRDEESSVAGRRDVYLYRYASQGNLIRTRRVGQIDMNAGIMTLNALYTDYDITMKIVVALRSNDVVGRRNLLLNIDTTDSIVSAYPDEITQNAGQFDTWKQFDKAR